MSIEKMVLDFWKDVVEQNPEKLLVYFDQNAVINWHNTNERFTPAEYIIANCEYPGEWCGEVKRIEIIESLVISVTRVWIADKSVSFHVTSFIKLYGEKIIGLDEYWAEDGDAPQWRQDKNIGTEIKK